MNNVNDQARTDFLTYHSVKQEILEHIVKLGSPGEIDHTLPISGELERISWPKVSYRLGSIKSTTCGTYAADLMGVHAESPSLLMMHS
jgi:hypothetical protein